MAPRRKLPRSHRRCSWCKVDKHHSEYNRWNAGGWLAEDGSKRNYLCKPCHYEQTKPYRRSSELWRKFKITPEDYDEMLESQEHKCAICGLHVSNQKRRLAVDHVPGTDPPKVVGLLCDSCNLGLGKFKHDIALLEQVIEYLQQRYSV